MKKTLLILTLFAAGFLSAQGNGDYVNMTFIKTTPGEDYGTILNEKWKELAQMRVDEGTITGWDVWWRPNSTDTDAWNMLLVTIAKHPDSLGANAGVKKMRPNYSDMDVEIFQQKNLKARTIVYDHTYANKGLNFAANQGETPDVPQVAVINFMKTDITNGHDYEKAENSLNSGDLGERSGWGLLKRLDQIGEDVYNNYMTVDFYDSWETMIKTREQTVRVPKQMQAVIKMRSHLRSIPIWRAISIRPGE
tara:strand:- start:1980 stop:2729 length:750 start_codon:yes stop_codon:yes gene_type:complete